MGNPRNEEKYTGQAARKRRVVMRFLQKRRKKQKNFQKKY